MQLYQGLKQLFPLFLFLRFMFFYIFGFIVRQILTFMMTRWKQLLLTFPEERVQKCLLFLSGIPSLIYHWLYMFFFFLFLITISITLSSIKNSRLGVRGSFPGVGWNMFTHGWLASACSLNKHSVVVTIISLSLLRLL